MIPAQVISKKRHGHALSPGEIAEFIDGYIGKPGTTPVSDAQMAALAMAIYFRGMDRDETTSLVEAMLRSGEVLAWPAGGAAKVDKHSTGGIGDKSSLILAPLLACCDLQVPMISGRGLGPSGGTLDKLESIPGFRTDLSLTEIQRVIDRAGCVITGATPTLVPADQKLYALRDVTGTAPSIPLICASIMSKKLAEGLDALVLDVKFGSGALIKQLDDARKLAVQMVETGARMGVRTAALLTDMNQPSGRLAGNAVEVYEAVLVLQGEGPEDLKELVLALAGEVLTMTGHANDAAHAQMVLESHLTSGRALEKFRAMVAAQGGDLDAPRPVAQAIELAARESGYVQRINAEELGHAIVALGGGRTRGHEAWGAPQPIDHSVGLEMLVRIGDAVEHGQPIARLFCHGPADYVAAQVLGAIQIGPELVQPPPLIVERIAT